MHELRRWAGAFVSGALFVCLTASCVPSPHLSADPSGGDVITEEDIARVQARTAYDAIMKIHANFLSFRGQTSLLGTSDPNPTVYIDDVRYGPVASLHTIPATQIRSIRLYRAWSAHYRFGEGNMGGVIEIRTKH